MKLRKKFVDFVVVPLVFILACAALAALVQGSPWLLQYFEQRMLEHTLGEYIAGGSIAMVVITLVWIMLKKN